MRQLSFVFLYSLTLLTGCGSGDASGVNGPGLNAGTAAGRATGAITKGTSAATGADVKAATGTDTMAGAGTGSATSGGSGRAQAPNPAPSIGNLEPASVAAGGTAFTLTVNGSNFTNGTQVAWNGSARTTTYVSSREVTATIRAPDVAIPGTALVTVASGAPAGPVSAAAKIALTGTVPANMRFVAQSGNDANPGTAAQPYLTIQKCAATVAPGATCAVETGTYRETVTPKSGIVITSYDGESVTVDGTDPVTGWTMYRGAIYRAPATLSQGDGNQVFVGNQMMTEARWPNGDDLFHVNWETAQAGTSSAQLIDTNLPNIPWTGAKIHWWSGADPWDPQTGTITASQSGQATFTLDGASFRPYIVPQAGGYYYLFGVLGALDVQREWFYDSSANLLYFWAPGGVNPGTLEVRAKQRPYAFDLSGASGVTIENLKLFACTIKMDASSANNTIDGITATYVSHFSSLPDNPGSPASYWYDHLSDSGIIINGSGNVLENSTIAYSAGNGVALLGSNNLVANNLIHHVDYMATYDSAIALAGTGQHIEHNTIHATGRAGIFPGYNAGSGNDIGYNNIYNAMMLSRDGGEIYISYPGPSGMAIHNNWLHDTQSLIPGPADSFALAGVYLDEDTGGYQVEQNVLWNNQVANIFIEGSNDGNTLPNDNDVHNNSIPDVNPTGRILISGIVHCGTTQIVNNQILVPVQQWNMSPACAESGNGATAAGANQMTASVPVGCNFAGCASEGPPAISGSSVAASIAAQPHRVTVSAGQSATFSVIGAGSAPLSYQWSRNGASIDGATSRLYTTPATTAADNGAVFTVTVGNSISRVTSLAAVLTVD